jgi:hypothetical protein
MGANLDERIAEHPYGGLPILVHFGDCQQLPPVGLKPHYSDVPSKGESNCTDAQGRLVFQCLLEPIDAKQEVSVVVVMDETHHQKDPQFKEAIQQMHDGNVTRETARMFLSCSLDELPKNERIDFEDNVLYAMLTWKSTIPIMVQYLKKLGQPVAQVNTKFAFHGQTNHAAKELNLPVHNALAVDSVVMLLVNFIVEWKLFSGTVGQVVEIVYSNPNGPQDPDTQPAYVVVDFPNSCIPTDKAWCPEKPTLVPIPAVTLCCKNNCCSMTTIPLHVCKAITIYKSQGMTVRDEQVWTKIVVMLPASTSTPGLEQVGLSRTTSLDCLALLSSDESPLTVECIMKVGKSPAYEERRQFEQ